ncbi:MAG: Class peptide chain release factor [Gemmatimonadetes bacterium]|nr:Class peptide chain release factor [Gemmatimonadota bacterium]
MGKEGSLEVTPALAIPRTELEFRASRAGGAGGQHVNTSSTRIELVWNVRGSSALDEPTRERIVAKLSSRIDGEGWIRVVSSARRSQLQNREAAELRLAELIRAAMTVQKRRRATKPSRGAKEARLSEKKKRGETKRQRRKDVD